MINLSSSALLGASFAGLVSCASVSESKTMVPLTVAGYVTSVELTGAPEDNASFRSEFEAAVLRELRSCANGPTPLRVIVELNALKPRGIINTVVIAGSNRISGQASIIDKSGAKVGEYVIGRRIWATGLGGLALLSDYKTTLSGAFGKELCDRAFQPMATPE